MQGLSYPSVSRKEATDALSVCVCGGGLGLAHGLVSGVSAHTDGFLLCVGEKGESSDAETLTLGFTVYNKSENLLFSYFFI